MFKILWKNVVRDATRCPMHNLNVESLFLTKYTIIETWSLTLLVITHFLAFSKFGLDSGIAFTTIVR